MNSNCKIEMSQTLFQIALVVDDYDRAIDYFVNTLNFELLEDTRINDEKRWVRVKPRGAAGASLLLAKAANAAQQLAIGNQSGGRVFLFLHTDRIREDVEVYKSRGVNFIREPESFEFGMSAVFEDIYGNKWDLIEPNGK